MYKIASDFLSGVISTQPKQLEHKDLFYILTNFRSHDVYPDELLKNKNFFYLYIIHKIPFDLNVLKLLPSQYHECVSKIEAWNYYLKTGIVLKDIPLIFENKKSILVPNPIKQGIDENSMNADQIDVFDYQMNKNTKYKGVSFYSGGYPTPGMLSFENPATLPLILSSNKTIEFFNFLSFYNPQPNETVAWVSPKEKTLEQIKLNIPDVLVFEANSFFTTKEEYVLAYVLCRKKLIIIRDTSRQDLIKKWLVSPVVSIASIVVPVVSTVSQVLENVETNVPDVFQTTLPVGDPTLSQIPPIKKTIWTTRS